jgi:prephenate dehydrogenase
VSHAGSAADAADLVGPVLVVGAGLLGTSVGLALRRRQVPVWLEDTSQENLRTATGLGAGQAWGSGRPALVVVAVPPDHLADAVVTALETTDAVVTDVGSVKVEPLRRVRERVTPAVLARYVGTHPLAGSERSGPLAASAAMFEGRPWAITPHEGSSPDAVAVVTALAQLCGAAPFSFTPEAHDAAVARTSHLPHVVAALVAGALADAPPEHMALSGQGVRDVTRVAAGDPRLWEQILAANATPVADLLRDVQKRLDVLVEALDTRTRPALRDLLARGVDGTAVIPGKHGGPPVEETGVFVVVPDHPGELARLFADVGSIGVNVEDVHIDHDPGRRTGLVELRVAASSAAHLLASLEARGWAGHG